MDEHGLWLRRLERLQEHVTGGFSASSKEAEVEAWAEVAAQAKGLGAEAEQRASNARNAVLLDTKKGKGE